MILFILGVLVTFSFSIPIWVIFGFERSEYRRLHKIIDDQDAQILKLMNTCITISKIEKSKPLPINDIETECDL